MYPLRMYLKVTRMFGAGFETSARLVIFLIKIMELCWFCAMDYTTVMLNRKTNEIANVCERSISFIDVMFVGVPTDNMIDILLIC